MRMKTPAQVSILILGAGPTGLGAATRLQQHGVDDWLMLDQVRCAAWRAACDARDARSARPARALHAVKRGVSSTMRRGRRRRRRAWPAPAQADGAGGLACTDVTPQGFYFDMGGHVMFSHWDYFDEVRGSHAAAGMHGCSMRCRAAAAAPQRRRLACCMAFRCSRAVTAPPRLPRSSWIRLLAPDQTRGTRTRCMS